MNRIARRLLLLTTAALLLAAPAAWAGIAVQPASVTLKLDKGRPSGKFVISNTGPTEERYRVRAAHFGYTLDGGLQLLPPDEHSLATWVKFNPKEFSLPPNSKRAVRFVIVPRGPLQEGEYWGAMELESLNTSTATSSDKEGRELRLKIVPSVLVPIYGRVGNVRHDGRVADLAFAQGEQGPALAVTVANIGMGRLFVRGDYHILDENNREVYTATLPRGLVLPGLQRRFVSLIDEPLSSGRYTIRVEYGATPLGERKMTDEQSFVLQ